MITIWKTVIDEPGRQTIEVPWKAQFLCAREQGDQICVWYRCESEAPLIRHTIAVCGTGHPAPEGQHWRYHGTAALMGGALMFHVFVEETL